MTGARAISSLGYLGLRVADLDAWHRHAVEVLGMMAADRGGPDRRFRIDEQAWRISLAEGEDDDIEFVGFEVPHRAALDVVAARLEATGIAVQAGDAALCADRGVLGLIQCRDPEDLLIEVYYGPDERQGRPFVSPAGVSGFVTGDQGLGHVVLRARDVALVRAFYCDGLGFSLSDIIALAPGHGRAVELEFYHCNPRHHTLALVPGPSAKRLHHFMLQARLLDDVGLALDRAAGLGTHVALSLGRHSNDHMVSFYAVTPSGFQVEYGWGARDVDADTWRVVRHDRTSIWGHRYQPLPRTEAGAKVARS